MLSKVRAWRLTREGRQRPVARGRNRSIMEQVEQEKVVLMDRGACIDNILSNMSMILLIRPAGGTERKPHKP